MNPSSEVPESRREARLLRALFWALLATFALVLGSILVPFLESLMGTGFLPLLGAYFVLGLALLVLSIRAKHVGAVRKFLILTGASSVGLAVSSVLHNVFYGLATLTEDWAILKSVLTGLEVAFFLIATIVWPLAFLAGAVGTIVHLIGRRGPRGKA